MDTKNMSIDERIKLTLVSEYDVSYDEIKNLNSEELDNFCEENELMICCII